MHDVRAVFLSKWSAQARGWQRVYIGLPVVLLLAFVFWWLWLLPTCQAECERQRFVDTYTGNEAGQSVVNLVQGLPIAASPYCLDGCLTLDPHSRQNWTDPRTLPTTPLDLKQALGVGADTPPLKVVYSIADEVLLADGSKLTIPLNEDLSMHYCLNNPDLRVDESRDCVPEFSFLNPSTGATETVLALEKDLGSSWRTLENAVVAPENLERFSGTVIFAKKVVICGVVETGGYDLVIIADDLEFKAGAIVDTTAPDRPVGRNIPDGYYDYGYAADGYEGGDLLLFAKNVIGTLKATTDGQNGDRERQYFAFDPTEFDWSTRLVELSSPQAFLETLPAGHVMREPGFRFFSQYHVFDVGEQGRGGNGGRPGNVTVASTSVDYEVDVQQNPGLGAESEFTISPDLVRTQIAEDSDNDGEADYRYEYTLLEPGVAPGPGQESAVPELTYRGVDVLSLFSGPPAQGKLIGPNPYACDGGILATLLLTTAGTRICTAYEPWVHANCQLRDLVGNDLYWCGHVHRQIDNLLATTENGGSEEPTDDSIPPTCGPLHCWCEDGYTLANGRCYIEAAGPTISEDDTGLITCNTRPALLDCEASSDPYDFAVQAQPELKIWGKRGLDGPSVAVTRHVVDVPLNITPFAATPSDFSGEAVNDCGIQSCLSATALAKVVYALAPQAVEILNVKGDNVYKQISDADLLAGDALYAGDTSANPLGYNRLDKARSLYVAAAHYCIDELFHAVAADVANENPFMPQCRHAAAQKAKLDRGLNYFGYSPSFYLYARPTEVSALFDVLMVHGLSRRGAWIDATGQLRDVIAAGVDASIDVAIRESEVEEASTYIAAAMADMESSGTKTASSLEAIAELSEQIAISETALEPLIQDLEDAIAALDECDPGCWATRVWTVVRAIVKIVAAIYTMDWAGAASSVEAAVTMIEDAATAVDGIIAVGRYVSLLFDGRSGELTYRVSSDCSGMGPAFYLDCIINEGEEITVKVENAEAFKKEVVDPAITVVEQAKILKEVTEEILDQFDGNPLAQALASVGIRSDQLATNLFENLNGVYTLQAAFADDPATFAKAKVLEDHLKQIMSLNRGLKSEYRNHVNASAELYAKLVNLDAVQARVDLAVRRFELESSRLVSLDDDRLRAELMINAACRSSRSINDLMLLAQYLYRRTLAYLLLQGADTGSPYRHILRGDDWDSYESADVNQSLTTFIVDILRPLRQPTVVTDIINPLEWSVSSTVGATGTTYTFSPRTLEEIQEQLCPAGSSCLFNKEQYNHAFINELRQDGVASFEVYPESLPQFRQLPDTAKHAWNLGFTSSDSNHTRLRVIDVASRVLMDGWTLPDPSLVSSLSFSHEESARFRIDADSYQDFYFSGDSLAMLCRVTETITNNDLPCANSAYFMKEIQTPFAEARTSYEDLSNVTAAQLESSPLYGTSVRGFWTVDISNILDQLENFQTDNPGYNGCSAEAPCDAVEEFWQKFRGIEYKVYSVPIN